MRTFMLSGLAAAAFFSLSIFHAAPAHAEGNCPSGYYPVVGQGVVGCAPIPQDRPLVAQEPARWHTRFGGLAFDPNSGMVVGSKMKRTADDAAAAAMADCERKAERACKSLGTYSNGCIVAMRPVHLTGEPLVNYADSIGRAKAVPSRFCADKGFKCEVVYSACSKASWF